MKKLAFLFVAMAAVSFAACGNQASEAAVEEEAPVEVVEEVAEAVEEAAEAVEEAAEAVEEAAEEAPAAEVAE